jgi:hypothetical protein
MKRKSEHRAAGGTAAAVRHLERTVERIPDEYPHVFHPGKELLFTYLKGIVYGLGALTAVAIVVPLLVAMLQQVQWVPLVGDFVSEVGRRIEESQR